LKNCGLVKRGMQNLASPSSIGNCHLNKTNNYLFFDSQFSENRGRMFYLD